MTQKDASFFVPVETEHPSGSGPLNKLAECEQALLHSLASPRPTLSKSWLDEVRTACSGDDAGLRAVVDELDRVARLTLQAESPSATKPSPQPPSKMRFDPRFGYGLVVSADSEAITASFALLLQDHVGRPAHELATAIPELALADYGLWSSLQRDNKPIDVSAVARRWLESPARKLAWDLVHLEQGIDTARLMAAVGRPEAPRPEPEPGGWPPLHTCAPASISPDLADNGAVVRALRELSAPTWWWSRSVAISALLDRAANEPVYSAGSIRTDLRDELAARFGAIFDVPDDLSLLSLEWELLRVAVTLVPAEHEGAVVFAIARWLGYILVRSPFQSNDADVLAAHLSGLRRQFSVLEPHKEDDLFHPRRLLAMLGHDPLRWRDFQVALGAAGHYLGRSEQPRLAPMPVTLVDRLRQIAKQRPTMEEDEQEAATTHLASLSPGLRRHLAPSWVARAVLQTTKSSWLAQLDRATVRHALDRLKSPSLAPRYAWLPESIRDAARALSPDVQEEIAQWWRTTVPSTAIRANQLALAASAILAELVPDSLDRLDALVVASDPEWRPFIANKLVEEARFAKLDEVVKRYLGMLARLVDDPSLPTVHRQDALGYWADLILRERAYLSSESEERLRGLAQEPLVTSSAKLRSKLAQLGFDTRSHGGRPRR